MCNTNISPLAKKAKRKYINLPKVQNLLDMQKQGIISSDNRKNYMQTLFCTSVIKVNHDGKTQSEYCKNRCCAVCNSIRSVIRLNKFKEHLPQNAQITALTIPNCPPDKLPEQAAKMKKNLHQIREKLKRNGYQFQFVANLEVSININEKSGNYLHPHFHIIHSWLPLTIKGHNKKLTVPKNETQKIGRFLTGTKQKLIFHSILLDYWQKAYPESLPYLQKTEPISYEFGLMEAFKYSIKPFQFDKKSKNQTLTEYESNIITEHQKYLVIYDKLYSMQKGKRTFFSNIKTITEQEENNEIATQSEQTQKAFGTYQWQKNDWINEHGECLSGYIPTKYQEKTNHIFTKNIKTVMAKPNKPILIDRQITGLTILTEKKYRNSIKSKNTILCKT